MVSGPEEGFWGAKSKSPKVEFDVPVEPVKTALRADLVRAERERHLRGRKNNT
jgi:hypothetical protein